MFRRIFTRQRGDTIVEVLIAIAVVSSVLAIAYSTMNKNVSILRGNQERTEAAKLAQGQLEALKYMATINATGVRAQGDTPFCINGSNIVTLNAALPAADIETENFGQYNAACNSGLYYMSVKRDDTDLTGRTYKIVIRWDGFNTNRQEVIMVYKVLLS